MSNPSPQPMGQWTYKMPWPYAVITLDQIFMELCAAIPIGSKIRFLQKRSVYLVESINADNVYILRKMGAANIIKKAYRPMTMIDLYTRYKMGDVTCL